MPPIPGGLPGNLRLYHSRYAARRAAEVAELADGAILAIRQNYAPRHKILECAQILSDSKLPIIGCVMNYVAGGSSGSGYYGYGYGYGGYGYGYGSYGKGKDTTQINL